MKHAILAGVCASAICICIPGLGCGQTSEADDVQQIHPPAVMPAQDEKKPDVPKAVKSIIQQTNEFRAKEGRSAVKINEDLAKAAHYFADYMARTDRYGHQADGQRPADRAKKHGYDYCIILENIAYQYSSRGFTTDELANGFFEGWKKSPGHRRNMLDADVSDTGVAIARSERTGYYYAVQMFGRPKSQAIEFQISNRADATFHYRIGDDAFALEPHYTRSHTCCSSPDLIVDGTNDKANATAAEKHVKPMNGDRFVVTGMTGHFRFLKE